MKHRAKVLMIQGTTSNAGKSFITAGLCRVFAQDGYRTAPFKSQNMALNSYITKDGLEMGRAQVVQAQAAGIEPTVDMNPILLKPTSSTGSQVIVNGRVRSQMKAMDYFRHKRELIPEIMAAFDRLSEAYDIIVIEGAGSPAEINLKENDIVNMGLAKMVDAPVLLAADIDRGGVFASLYGTVKLLPKDEQTRIKGLIINKFRGDKAILDPGIKMIEDLLQIPVAGVLPMALVDIDDEDSLSSHLEAQTFTEGLDAAVIRLPHISNFTDFSAFERIEGVSVRYVSTAAKFGTPDLILLPGTKNTMADLAWLKNVGLAEKIIRYTREGGRILGICGGYQMMGEVLEDPFGVEEGGRAAGLGLFPAVTVFSQEKTRTQIDGCIINGDLRGTQVSGYEIHMGQTSLKAQYQERCFEPWIRLLDGRMDGIISPDGRVCGTYLHGMCDGEAFLNAWLAPIFEERGIKGGNAVDAEAYREQEYDKLAKVIRDHMDMAAVYQMMGL